MTSTGAAAVGSALAWGLDQPSASAAALGGVLNQGERTVEFNQGWKFQLVNTEDVTDPSGRYGTSDDPKAAATAFDDSAWRQLTLPHDWSIEQQPNPAERDGTGYFPGGLGWYRKTFTLPSSMTGKHLTVDFDGVYMNSYVYLNGELLGNHPYGYTGFSFDLTGKAHTDGRTPNVLAVVVQNKQPSSRWYSGTGITRNVHLTATHPVRVGRWGTFVTTPDLGRTIKNGYATVRVETTLAGADGKPAEVVSTIRDAAGHPVATGHGTTAEIKLANPRLWSTTDPYLYTLRSEVLLDKKVVDSYDTTFGVRWLDFDPDNGVSLNGKHLKLQGVCLHNDQGALGSVNNHDALWRQMTTLQRAGVNALRTSHNPPSPEMLDVCQRLGIVMMVEAFDCWHVGKLDYDYHLYFDKWSDSDLAEMVHAAKNSPAVIMWSIGNEIPDWTEAASLPIEKRLIAGVKKIDTTRPVTANCDQYRDPPAAGSPGEQMLQNLDLVGFSYEPARVMDTMHATYPTKMFFESESSSCTSARGVYQDPSYVNTGQNYTPGKRLPSAYDNNMSSWTMSHEYVLKVERDRRYSGGQFVWTGTDYIGEPTPYAQFPVKTSAFGLVDTAGFPKDAYFAFKSQWTSAPMVHLVPMDWTGHEPGQEVEVRAYSNVRSVELLLNGRSLGTRSYDVKTTVDGARYLETTEPTGDDKNFPSGSYTSPNGSTGKLHLTWRVPFQPGKLSCVARDDRGRVVARDELTTAGPPLALRLTADRPVVPADGKALAYVAVDVVDQGGIVNPGAADAITFAVSGAGSFAGADNGKEDSGEGYTSTTHTAFNGKALAIVRAGPRPGAITVTATSPGLAPATTTVFAVDGSASGLVATQPVSVRTVAGTQPALPSTVTGVYADGSTAPLDVRWSGVGSSGAATYSLTGSVARSSVAAHATVVAYTVAAIEPYSTVTPVGAPPYLPSVVVARYTDGVTQTVPVSWDGVGQAKYDRPGSFTVGGSAAGRRATATVRVTDSFAPDRNIALATSPAKPTADAGYSGSPDSVPAGLLDGVTTSGGWSNAYTKSATYTLPEVSKAHAADWVSVSWPEGQRISTVVAYFTLSASLVLPRSIVVSYWDGARWLKARDQQVQFATQSNAPTTITFQPVSTTSIRLTLTSPAPDTATGFFRITELEVPAAEITS
ncbi:glycoside hydrolase family 2 TIM barrel-domain containing protein [Amycolatopsis sp. NBC_01480]|uniref:glycoside hydrolase family 2 TIM barrel-domain containing protein n=1 Tax=Amycolatopsis sp. NBC_01480 TaxID=2903562 RepID=UPI002E2C354B|nr:glycoside hydrolase family 2 TIM barrel-domain containing protein [Amycolatopsis sp. NBC_01480]